MSAILEMLVAAHCRQMREEENLPADLNLGLDQIGKLDPNWVWVVDEGGEITGALIASPCHGIVALWRIVSRPGSSPVNVRKVLRKFFVDIRERGYLGCIVFLDPLNETEAKLARFAKRVGGKTVGGLHMVWAGKIPKEAC